MFNQKIGMIGTGKIGSAILRGVLRSGLVGADQVLASDLVEQARSVVAKDLGIEVVADNGKVCDFADLVILAVKPQVVEPVLEDITAKIGKRKIVVSIAAGVPIKKIESRLDKGARVVRVMTNTPCVVGAAASCYAPGSHATPEDLEKVGMIFQSVGIALPLEEHYLDAVTGLSGSGPAYVLLFIESLADGGVQAGLSRDVALKLALQTVYGSAKLAMESGKHLGQLRDEVTSPGGTTIAGIYALERNSFRGGVMEAVWNATRRSQELGKS